MTASAAHAVTATESPASGPLLAEPQSAPSTAFGRTFTPNHSHYTITESAVIDSGDVEAAIRHVVEHFGTQANSQIIFLCHPDEAEQIASFRAGEENNNEQTARYSFIPSAGAPAYWLGGEPSKAGTVAERSN